MQYLNHIVRGMRGESHLLIQIVADSSPSLTLRLGNKTCFRLSCLLELFCGIQEIKMSIKAEKNSVPICLCRSAFSSSRTFWALFWKDAAVFFAAIVTFVAL